MKENINSILQDIHGLTKEEVAKSREKYCSNELAKKKKSLRKKKLNLP